MFELRGYQREMLVRLEAAWAEHRSVLVQMPTGTGKSVLIAEAIRSEKRKVISDKLEGGKVLVVVHRRELIEQIRRTLEAYGLGDDVVVESIQKLSRGGARRGQEHCNPGAGAPSSQVFFDERSGEADYQTPCALQVRLVIIDEAHHALARTYRELWDRWPEAKFLGLTATPCRLSGEAFTDLFEVLLQSWSIQQFIDKGWLSDFEYVSAAPGSAEMRRLGQLDKRGADGDYQMKQMATVMDVPESIEHLYETYREYVNGKKGIVYAIDREHAQHIAAYYSGKGVRCAVIDSKTPAKERERLVEAYRLIARRGQEHCNPGAGAPSSQVFQTPCAIDVLVNVDIFGEGFDVPEVEFIQLARPTLSLSKYLQQVGRGMRVSEGKEAVTILDNVGMYMTFGLPTDERDWRLMFLGKVAGKGCLTGDYPLVVAEHAGDEHAGDRNPVICDADHSSSSPRVLINLEMVRIKRRNERHEGVEVFMQGGKYGIMNDGKVTCRPEFAHIQWLKGGKYYAVATYPYEVFRSKKTIISKKGQDLRVTLYGKVTPHGEVVEGETIAGKRTFWDGVGLQYYSYMPDFEEVGGVQMICKGGKYLPRQASRYQKEPVEKRDIWFNDYILWMDKVVIIKKTGKAYPIEAYGANCFYVKDGEPYTGDYLKVGLNGNLTKMTALEMELVLFATKEPSWSNEQMIWAPTGKLEYLGSTYEQRRRRLATVL